MSPQFLRLIPTYGNWGGPGWSGGKRAENYLDIDWDVPTLDSLDELFYKHDKGYRASRSWSDIQRVDQDLLADIRMLSPNPATWGVPPPSALYARLYRTLAIFTFKRIAWVRGKLLGQA